MIDPIRFQALVDGECSASERRRMLAQIDSQPERWRELALALLEEQAFRNEIRGMRSEPTVSASEPSRLVSYAAGTESSETQRGKVSKSWYLGPFLAACLVLSIGIAMGRYVMRSDLTVVPWGESATGMLAENDSSPLQSTKQRSLTQDEYEQTLPVADLRNDRNRYEIPVYDVNHVDPALVLAKRAYEIEKVKEQLRRNGYDVDLRHDYLTGQLQDGRKVIVPIQQVGLKPYGQ